MFTSLRTAAVALAFTVGAVAYSGAASAQTFTFTGTTAGCFTAGCVPAPAAADGPLGFTAGAFSVLAPAFVGGNANIGNSPVGNNLGTFALGGTPANFNGDVFRLAVTFTVPTTSPTTGTFNAILSGVVVAGPAGGAHIDFTTGAIPFTFSQGAFTLTVNDVDVSPNGNAPITGQILITAVPGPVAGAGIPVLLGMAGAWFVRRRRQARTA
jgi:hypothetical protein